MTAIPNPTLITRQEVTDHIPHRAPMVLIDRLLSISGPTAVGDLQIRPDNPFLSAAGELSVGGLIEHMAQTIALEQGYAARAAGDREPRFGFIVNVRNLRYCRLPRTGDRIETHATRISPPSRDFSKVDFRCYHNQELIAECTMGLMVRDN